MIRQNSFNDEGFLLDFIKKNYGAILVAEAGNAVYLNDNMKSLLGYNDELLLPVHVKKLFPPAQFGDFFETITNLESSENSIDKIKVQLKDRTAHLFKLINNEKVYLIVQVNELNTDWENGNVIDNLSEIFPFIFVETDGTGQILNYCKSLNQALIYQENEILTGHNLVNLVAPASKPVLESLFNNYQEFKKTESIELKLRKKDGSSFPVNMYYKAKTNQRTLCGLSCVLIDATEKKIIENKYRYNQQRLRKILDLVPHMIFLKDKDGKILLSNKACADFYDKNARDIVYENIGSLHKDESELNRIISEDRAVIEGMVKKEWDNLILTDSQNNKRIFKTTKVPYQDAGSDEVYSLGISQDITQQRKAELEKEEANLKYRLLVEKGNDGILIITDNKIVFANNQAARIVGKSVNEILGFPLNSFIPKDQLKVTLEQFKTNTFNRNIEEFYSFKLKKADHTDVYVEAKISTINYLGKKSRMVFVRDISKRKLAELQSERDRTLLEQAQKIANLGSWEWDIAEKRLLCSDELCKILEISKEIWIDKDLNWLSEFIPDTERKKVQRGFLKSITSGIKLDTEFPVIAYSNERKIIHSQSIVINDNYGKPSKLMGTWLDITERIKIEQMLKVAKMKAEESDKLKSAFLANMSHEIRTPMNAVMGFANLLKRNDVDEKTKLEYLEHILQSGESLILLINDIVDISKIESNQLKIEKCPVRLNEILEQIYNRYEELLLLKNNAEIRIKFETAFPDPEFTIITDPFRLQQILSNLLINAIKFTPNGEIKFGYSIINSELLFFVQDQGIGIPDDKKEEIFKRFTKLEDPERMNKSGTGLGLSIAKSLLDLLGGRIWLDSTYSEGARFCFTLPLEVGKKKCLDKFDKQAGSLQDIKLNNKTILIAEDEMLNYKLLETLLKKTGANILWAKNGLDAIRLTTDNKIDLVFMDIKMPDMNGYEATKQIKRIDPGIPVIAQTAFAFANERNYILQSGCDMYMTKPIDHKELVKALKTFLV